MPNRTPQICNLGWPYPELRQKFYCCLQIHVLHLNLGWYGKETSRMYHENSHGCHKRHSYSRKVSTALKHNNTLANRVTAGQNNPTAIQAQGKLIDPTTILLPAREVGMTIFVCMDAGHGEGVLQYARIVGLVSQKGVKLGSRVFKTHFCTLTGT